MDEDTYEAWQRRLWFRKHRWRLGLISLGAALFLLVQVPGVANSVISYLDRHFGKKIDNDTVYDVPQSAHQGP